MAEEGPWSSDESWSGDLSPRSPSSNVLGLDQDLFMHPASILRIIRKGKVLPADAKIAKDTIQTYQECVSLFISFITSEASDNCRKDERRSLTGDDLLEAMETLGFEDYVKPLEAYLEKYREDELLRSLKDHDESVRKEGVQLQPDQDNTQ
uniref:Transcription factor CBF/NF-Y/archaeal histone domain-containing protein n=1 Tax=Lactuca sativa TaxID=4236 RepID=A0A9R1V539_LACSA|nr:hypothetical protein LSAT_V11C600310690 [Lactuca sativa]